VSSRRVLVVGATGILRPAAVALAVGGDRVVAVARGRAELGELADATGAAAVAFDATRAELVRELVPAVDAAIVYRPAVSDGSLAALAPLVRRRGVLVLPSGAADPAAVGDELDFAALPPAPGPCWRRLLLGWAEDGPEPRWHSPDEVSAAAVHVLDTGEEAVLGTVRPWARRP
jgi:hypothetical protein